jgi:hypothetical protein
VCVHSDVNMLKQYLYKHMGSTLFFFWGWGVINKMSLLFKKCAVMVLKFKIVYFLVIFYKPRLKLI